MQLLLPVLKSLTLLASLCLDSNKIEADGGAILCQSFAGMESLETYLISLFFFSSFLSKLFLSLDRGPHRHRHCTNTCTLIQVKFVCEQSGDCWCRQLGCTSFTSEPVESSLSHKQQLWRYRFDPTPPPPCNAHYSGIECLMSVIGRLSMLEKLSLGYNGVSSAGAVAISNGLQSCLHLTELWCVHGFFFSGGGDEQR